MDHDATSGIIRLLIGTPQTTPPFSPRALPEQIRKIIAVQRRRVFICYHEGDQAWANHFVESWGPDGENICDPTALGVSDDDDFVDSTDTEYIMQQIRSKYLYNTSVTIVLIGECTHSRRYVDWEIKSSLRQEPPFGLPNGLIGILIPNNRVRPFPPRLQLNIASGYVKLHPWPQNGLQLRSWIEQAFQARSRFGTLIKNHQEKFEYNHVCRVHGRIH